MYITLIYDYCANAYFITTSFMTEAVKSSQYFNEWMHFNEFETKIYRLDWIRAARKKRPDFDHTLNLHHDNATAYMSTITKGVLA